MSYKDTLFLPKTDFPMRGNPNKTEIDLIDKWDSTNLHSELTSLHNGQQTFTLHDGPPYANGNIHIGHAANKIFKDIINRSQHLLGYHVNYKAGWDCHGLPIEWKVEEEYRSKGLSKDDVDPKEFRQRCREYAQKWVDTQTEEFKRLGVVADWDNSYLTMNPESEATICDELLKIAMKGNVYRGFKPIMWSPVEETALAEAEVEYKDRKTTAIYVKYPITDQDSFGLGDDLSVVIYTTTPWTIPASQMVCFNEELDYAIYHVDSVRTEEELGFKPYVSVGDRLVLAVNRAHDVMQQVKALSWTPERVIGVEEIADSKVALRHPLYNQTNDTTFFNKPIKLVSAPHVTDDMGTGFVHTAPAHGDDDFNAFLSNGYTHEDILNIVDSKGRYNHPELPESLQGLGIIRTTGKKKDLGKDGKANAEVLKQLVANNTLLSRVVTNVRDAHSWRSGAPVIRKATPQWFISMSRNGLGENAVDNLDDVKFFPPKSKNRLKTMVEGRPDWLISRQRKWGVPITLLVGPNGELHTNRPDAERINNSIIACIKLQGIEGWFDNPVSAFIPNDYEGWTKVEDILDVWFDSGCTHTFALKNDRSRADIADLVVEGSDQHRGWFQSSLLQSSAIYGEAPYKSVFTHGFVVDAKGRKMSKSEGNVVHPQAIIKKYGADVLRLWVATSDLTSDIKLSDESMETSASLYHKLRNTLRYMTGAITGIDEDMTPVQYESLPSIEKWVLHRLYEVSQVHGGLVKEHNHKAIVSLLTDFCVNDLSRFYFEVRKDALYCDPLNGNRRRACLQTIAVVFNRLVSWLSPILPFTTEEAWRVVNGNEYSSVHFETFGRAWQAWENRDIADGMDKFLGLKSEIYSMIEPYRKDGQFKSSLQAFVDIDEKYRECFEMLGWGEVYEDPKDPTDTVADMLVVSLTRYTSGSVVRDAEQLGYRKCERSWKYFMGDDDISPRDRAAVDNLLNRLNPK